VKTSSRRYQNRRYQKPEKKVKRSKKRGGKKRGHSMGSYKVQILARRFEERFSRGSLSGAQGN